LNGYGIDGNGPYKNLPDGRVLRVRQQIYNTLLTLSSSKEAQCWEHGW
jgi:hypothetical protein